MVKEHPVTDRVIVGKMGMAPVYKLDTGGPLWTEYSHRGNTYRSNGGGFVMKRVARKIEHFDSIPLGRLQEILKEKTDDLIGVDVIMKPTSSLTPDRQERGGQLLVVGWSYDITIEERDFFDALDTASR